MDTTGRRQQVAEPFDDITVDELRRRGSVKWTMFGPDVLAAWVAEMDFPLAPPIRDALQTAVERSVTGYPPPDEASGLPVVCAAWLAERFGVRVAPAQIKILPDVLKGIELAIVVFSPPGSRVVITTPSYPPFFDTVRAAGREIVESPLRQVDGVFTFDLDTIDAALAAGAGTLILCNPYNSVGRAFTRQELAALAEVVERRGARVVADEVHAPLVYPGAEHVSYSTVSEAAARHSVTMTSASKGWNVAGLKTAEIVLTNEEDVEHWERLPYVATHGASILGIVANRVAFTEGGPWLDDVVRYLDGNRALLDDLLAEHIPEIRYTIPQATYLAWLDCRALGLDNPAAFFLDRARVALQEGAAFGAPGIGHVRLNFATSRPILTQIVDRMASALAAAPPT